jgi:hypothetical protein
LQDKTHNFKGLEGSEFSGYQQITSVIRKDPTQNNLGKLPILRDGNNYNLQRMKEENARKTDISSCINQNRD